MEVVKIVHTIISNIRFNLRGYYFFCLFQQSNKSPFNNLIRVFAVARQNKISEFNFYITDSSRLVYLFKNANSIFQTSMKT